MNKLVKNIVVFASGLGIGALGTYFVVKDKYEGIMQDEIEAMRERLEIKEVAKDDSLIKLTSHGLTEKVTVVDGQGEEAATKCNEKKKVLVLHRDKYEKIARRYMNEASNSIYDPAESERPSEDAEETYLKYEKMSEDANSVYDKSLPYIISTEEFNEEMGHFDKLTLSYYELDRTLADEGEEIIEDPLAAVGEDTLTRFGEDSDDPDIVYVRNEKRETDYEIICVHQSYAETVLGMEPAEVSSIKKAKLRRRGPSENERQS